MSDDIKDEKYHEENAAKFASYFLSKAEIKIKNIFADVVSHKEDGEKKHSYKVALGEQGFYDQTRFHNYNIVPFFKDSQGKLRRYSVQDEEGLKYEVHFSFSKETLREYYKVYETGDKNIFADAFEKNGLKSIGKMEIISRRKTEDQDLDAESKKAKQASLRRYFSRCLNDMGVLGDVGRANSEKYYRDLRKAIENHSDTLKDLGFSQEMFENSKYTAIFLKEGENEIRTQNQKDLGHKEEKEQGSSREM